MYADDYSHAKDLFVSAEEMIRSVRRATESLELIEGYYSHVPTGIVVTSSGPSFESDRIGNRIAGCTDRLDKLKANLEADILRRDELVHLAEGVCYGWSGKGGLAKALSREDADILYLHYIKGRGWASIAQDFNPDAKSLSKWCSRRAEKAMRKADRIGIYRLALT